MSHGSRSVFHAGLFALAIALGVVLALDRGRPTTSELSARSDHLFPILRRDEFTELRIVDRTGKKPDLAVRRVVDASGSARYVLGDATERDGDLDPAAVDGLLSALEFAKWHEPPRTIDPAEPLDLGTLDLEVRLEMGAVTTRLLIGAPVPTRTQLRRVEITATGAPRRTGFVSASLVERIGRDRSSFESRLLLPVGRDRTEALTITRGEQSVTLRSDGRGFVFETKDRSKRRVGRDALDRLFFQLARSTVEVSLPSPPMKASGTVEIRQRTRASGSGSGPEYVLSLGGECPGHPELIAAHRTAPTEISGCVPASIGSGVANAVDHLEDRSLVPLGVDEIDHLIVESVSGNAGRQLDLVRSGTEFVLHAPDERSVSLDAGNSFLETLLEARAPGQVRASLAPAARLRVFGHPPGATETAEFVLELLGEPNQAGWSVARRLDDGALLALDAATAWSLSKDASWFEDREILSIEPTSVRRLTTRAADGVEELIASDSEHDLAFANGSASDRSLTGATLAALHPLTALRWLPPAEGTAPAAPVVVVEVAIEGGKTERIVVESRVRGGYAAHLDGRPGRFVLPVRTVSTWLRSLADRAPATLIPADYTRVELRAGALEHVLERRGEHLVTTSEVDDGLGEAVEEALLGFVPIAARRGPAPSRASPVLTIVATATTVTPVTFRVYGPTTFEGVAVYELSVDAVPRSYFVEAGVVQALLDLL